MTTETTESVGAKTRQFMSQARKRQLITEIAIGEIPLRQLAHKYGVSYGHVRDIKTENREEIEQITVEIADKERQILWPTDRFARNYERITDLVQINEEMERHKGAANRFAESMEVDSEPTSEHWLRLVAQKQAILKAIAEDYGQLPTRAPAVSADAGNPMTYEVKGVDVAEVVKSWGQGQQ